MVPDDFNSSFRDQLAGDLPGANDPHAVAGKIVRRDLFRTRILAGLSLFFWLVGATGMLVLVLGLNRLVLFLRIGDGVRWNERGGITTVSSQQEQIIWGTNLIHHGMPFIEASVIALVLAALCTVLLVFSSYQATLTRINLSLAQIAEQFKRSPPPAPVAAAAPIPLVYQQRPRTGLWMVLGAVGLLVIVCGVFFSIARFTPADVAWEGYPRLSPFEAVRWQGQTPQVRVGGNWYEPLAIDEIPVSQIVAYSQFRGANDWQKHFEEDLVELMMRMGHDPGTSVTLNVKNLSSGAEQTLENVPMTDANRTALWRARNAADTQP